MNKNQSTGRYETRRWTSRIDDRLSGDIQVFIPDAPLAFHHDADPAALADAEHMLHAVNTSPQVARVGNLLGKVEAIASSRFEGLGRPTAHILDAAGMPGATQDLATARILGNLTVMEEAMQPEVEIAAHEVLHRWHLAVMAPRSDEGTPMGAYRVTQNWIGLPGSTPITATFVPAPADLIEPLMGDLLSFVNERTLSPIIQAAVAHAHFEAIHPFGDGNGRIGRALIYRMLASRGAIWTAPPPISPFILQDPHTYIAGLTAYRSGQTSVWVDTFVRLLDDACVHSLLLASAVANLTETWTERVSDVRRDSMDHSIVSELIENPILDAQAVAARFGKSTVAARDALERLEKRGILVERPLRRGLRGRPARVFEASGLLDLLDERPQSLAARPQTKR
ncbi:MAG: Fic family protein [Acidimicrobiia bacterium]